MNKFCVNRKTRLKFLKRVPLIGFVIIALILCLGLTSCGDNNEDEPQKSELCGIWQNQAFIYCFNPNGSGYFQYSPSNEAYEVAKEKSYFKWNASSTILSITFDGTGTINAGVRTYYYEINNNMLVLINTNTGDTDSFTKL